MFCRAEEFDLFVALTFGRMSPLSWRRIAPLGLFIYFVKYFTVNHLAYFLHGVNWMLKGALGAVWNWLLGDFRIGSGKFNPLTSCLKKKNLIPLT